MAGMTLAAWRCDLPDEERLAELARAIAAYLKPPLVIFLRGDLGAGKTSFARALIHALGYPGRVKSPTYGLLESYRAASCNILHLDLYRLEDPGELDYLGLRDLFDHSSILLIEWPEKGRGYLPAPDLELHFQEAGDLRFVELIPHSGAGRELSRKASGTT